MKRTLKYSLEGSEGGTRQIAREHRVQEVQRSWGGNQLWVFEEMQGGQRPAWLSRVNKVESEGVEAREKR